MGAVFYGCFVIRKNYENISNKNKLAYVILKVTVYLRRQKK